MTTHVHGAQLPSHVCGKVVSLPASCPRCASLEHFLDVGSNGALAPVGDYGLIVREAKAGIL